MHQLIDCPRLATLFLLIMAFASITALATAQDPWQLAIEDLPPLDFPGSPGGGESKDDAVPPYRLPLPSPTQTEPEDSVPSSIDSNPLGSEADENGSGVATNADAGTSDGDQDWLSEESMYNEPEEYQIGNFLAPVFSSSDWYRNGGWYVNATAEGIWRSSGKPKVLAKDLSGVVVNTTGTPILDQPINQITTRHKGFRFEPGLGLTIGRFLGRDYFNRDASVEFGFLGLFDWRTDLLLASADENQLFTALNLDGPGGSRAGQIVFGGSPVPLGTVLIPGFDAVDQQEFDYSSTFNSFEVNIRLSHRPGRDRMVAMPDGTWSRQLTEGGVPSFFAGMRYIGIKEKLLWLSRQTNDANVQGRYNVETGNKLFGLQFGGDYQWVTKNWSAGVVGKAGAYLNFANMQRQIDGTGRNATIPPGGGTANGLPASIYEEIFGQGTNPYTNATNLPGLTQGANYTSWKYRGSQTTSVYGAFLESKLFAQYNVNPNLSFRLSWDQFWINGLSMAPYQLHFEPARSKLNAGGNVYFTGLSLAGQWVW